MSLEQKLLELRSQWQLHPERRSIIELQAKIVKLGLLKAHKSIPEDIELSLSDVKEALVG